MSIAVRDELLAITALDALEQQHLSDALAWVESGAPLYRVEKPATPPKHLVSYFVLVDAEHLLLVDHIQAGLWLPSGGHVEPGEHPRQTVLREIKEELDFDVAASDIGAPLMITCTRTVGSTLPHTDVSLWYTVRGDRRTAIAFEQAEFHAVRWFAFDDVPFHRCDPHLSRFLEKLRRCRDF